MESRWKSCREPRGELRHDVVGNPGPAPVGIAARPAASSPKVPSEGHTYERAFPSSQEPSQRHHMPINFSIVKLIWFIYSSGGNRERFEASSRLLLERSYGIE